MKVAPLYEKLRAGRLRWFGHVQRRDQTYVGERVEALEVGRRKQGRPRRRMKDCYEDDVKEVGANPAMPSTGGSGDGRHTPATHISGQARRRRRLMRGKNQMKALLL